MSRSSNNEKTPDFLAPVCDIGTAPDARNSSCRNDAGGL